MKSAGFTIIELVATIILLGIISVGVSSRWFGADAFRINSLNAQFVSYARLAQRIAMANSSVTIHLRISQVSGDWLFAVVEDDAATFTTLHQVLIDAKNIGINVTAGIGPTSLSTTTALDVEFDAMGNIVNVVIGASTGVTDGGIVINVTGATNISVCISPLGFAHDGACV